MELAERGNGQFSIQDINNSLSEQEGALSPQERRRRQRLLRQKRAKLQQRAAAQESNHGSDSGDDRGVEQAYEQHLRHLQQLHPPAAGGTQPTRAAQHHRQKRSATKRKGKGKKRQGSSTLLNLQAQLQQQGELGQQQYATRGTATGSGSTKRQRHSGWASPVVAGSVDTLASAAAVAVPSSQPIQQRAQVSDLSGHLPEAAEAVPAAATAAQCVPALQHTAAAGTAVALPVLAWQPLAQVAHAELAAGAAPALVWQAPQLVLTPALASPCLALSAAGQQQQALDASSAAALIDQALAQQVEMAVAQNAAAKTAAICRLDLSSAALLIGAHWAADAPHAVAQPAAALAGTAAWIAGQQHTEPAVAAVGVDGAVEEGEDASVEYATEDAAGGGSAAAHAEELAAAAGSRRAQRRVYVHGNYHRYYGYRVFGSAGGQPPGAEGGAEEQAQRNSAKEQAAGASQPGPAQPAGAEAPEDPRLAAFDRKWFARRRCMDVGCNEGVVTLALVRRFHPRSMLGVDIDGALVARACRHLRDLRVAAGQRIRDSRRGGVPSGERKAARDAGAALSQTQFVCTDFLESDVEAGSADTITCLSVTKWVHLNRGDAGVQALFAAFWRALSRGGLLLLEPQPWSSYRAAAHKIRRDQAPPGSFFHRQDELRLRPDAFASYLCDELGFRLVKRLGVGGDAAAGFDRPMLLLRKPA